MSTDAKIWFMIFGLLVFAFVAAGFSFVYGQQQQSTTSTSEKVEQVQEEVQSTAAQVDATTVTAGVAGAGVIATFLNSFLKGRKLTEEDRKTDRDLGLSFLYLYKLVQAMDVYVPGVAKCLDQPFDADPMARHITIRMKLAEDAAEHAIYLKQNLNVAVPSMTPSANVIVAEAKSSSTVAATPTPQKSDTPPQINEQVPKKP